MTRYYEDRWTREIRSLRELQQMVERCELPRYQLARRFRALPPASCRLLSEAAGVVDSAERRYERP